MMLLPGFKIEACYHRGHGPHDHPHHGGGGSANQSAAATHKIDVGRRVLDVNEQMAAANRQMFSENGVTVINVMSSPGSGKTTTLVKTITLLQKLDIRVAVVVGDICTTNDADRLAATGVPSIQINTQPFGGDCHLTANGVLKTLDQLDLATIDLLIIENVGNLVCPAEFDIGEHARVVILSVTEGEDKPLKYPLMFRQCHVALLNKIDLLPHLNFDAALATANIHQIHPDMPVLPVSAQTGEGFDPWIDWLQNVIQT